MMERSEKEETGLPGGGQALEGQGDARDAGLFASRAQGAVGGGGGLSRGGVCSCLRSRVGRCGWKASRAEDGQQESPRGPRRGIRLFLLPVRAREAEQKL